MKRILHVIGKMDRAGAETMLMNLYRHMDRDTIQFDFVTFTEEIGDYDEEILKLGGRIFPVLGDNPISRAVKLTKFLKMHPEYEIVHAHTFLSNAFHLLAAKRAGVKYRISHSHTTSNGKSNNIKKIYEQWALIVNRRVATHKIACGELAAKYLFGTIKDVWLLPNAVDIEKMITVAKNSRNYIEQEFNSNGLNIIQIGRLNEVKNHQFSLKVAKELIKYNINFTLYIIGQGPLEEALKQQVIDNLLENNVKFLGLRTDITELMASADHMIMPSLYEGFPVVLVESQAVGLKTLVSDQVSSEVDLGLGSVEFLSLYSVKEWVDRLLVFEKSEINEKTILASLKSQGFDAVTNAQKLSKFYKSL